MRRQVFAIAAFWHELGSRTLWYMFSEDPTKRYRTVASILLVGASADQMETCKSCADELGVYIKQSELEGAAHAVEQWRPFALLASETVHASAEPQLEQLAQHSQATLVILKGSLGKDELHRYLTTRLTELLRQHFA